MINIKDLKKLYQSGSNINYYLRKKTNLSEKDIIKLSYDIQTGSYVRNFNYIKSKKNLNQVIKEINTTNFKTLMDFGCGELTNFYTLIKNIKTKNKIFFAYDFSFSRILIGKKFLNKRVKINLKCFSNDSIKIPLPDNSVDIVTTCHAIEPNKKNSYKILKELWRISKKKLILLEPNNNLIKKLPQNEKNKINKRFKKHNYVLNLEKKINKITKKYKIIKLNNHFNSLNPASLFVINKNTRRTNETKFLNPNDKSDVLKEKKQFYYSEKTGEIFPVIQEVIVFNKKETYIQN